MTAGLLELGQIMMAASQRRLETVSENIANISTPGFKARASFAEAVSGTAVSSPPHEYTDYTQGGLRHTGRALDLALSSSGFFVLRAEDETYYTRDGQFERQADGRVTDARGYALQTVEGGDLILHDASADIAADGTVLENGLPVAHIAVVIIDDGARLQSISGALFTAPSVNMQAVDAAIVRSGMLESSNVDGGAEMLRLMASMRQAEAGARVVQTYDSLVGQAISSFGRFGPMNGAFEVAAIGLESQQKALEIIANNVANINTPAFRRSDVRFSEMVATVADPTAPSASLSQVEVGGGVSTTSVVALNEQGDIERTGSPLDLAIDGPGFVELLGPHGQTLLWRGGALGVNEDGLLSVHGTPLRAMITIPDGGANFRIGADGTVISQPDSGETTTLGRIMLTRVDDSAALQAMDDGVYRVIDPDGVTEAAPSEDGMGSFVQGAIEHSNVVLNNSMIELMIVQRAYAANAQVVQAADQMMTLANNLRK